MEPELGVIRRADFFVDQIIEQLAAGGLIVAMRVHGGEVGREGGDVVIILARIISESGAAQFATGPGEVKGMSEKMFRGDLVKGGDRSANGIWHNRLGRSRIRVRVAGRAFARERVVPSEAASSPRNLASSR